MSDLTASMGWSLDGVTIHPLPGGKSKPIDISNSILFFDYFEDILQPSVSASIRIVNSYSLVSELPIRGGEKVEITIDSPMGSVFHTDRFELVMYVYKVVGIGAENFKDEFELKLTTAEHFLNEQTRCMKKYFNTNIDAHVKDIIYNVLYAESDVDDEKNVLAEETANTYSFIGASKKPFHALEWLGVKSISKLGSGGTSGEDKTGENKGTAGFLFYENQAGFNFRSIDSLVTGSQIGATGNPLFQYFYTGKVIEHAKMSNRFKIINFQFEKNIDLRKALSVGMYANETYFFDTYNNQLSLYTYDLQEETKNATKLGKEDKIFVKSEYTSHSTRSLFRFSDHGTLGSDGTLGDSGRDDGDMAKSFSRYNLLFTQALNISVPCNTKLKVGDLIYCEFPRMESGQPKDVDSEISGNYVIRNVRHRIAANQNVTYLKLMRDSYGLYGPDE